MKIHIHTPAYFPELVGMTYAADGHADILTELGHDVTIMVAGHPLGTALDNGGRAWKAIGSGLSGSGLPWSRLKGDVSGLLQLTKAQGIELILIEGWYTSAAAIIPRFKASGAHVIMASHGAADTRIDAYSFVSMSRAAIYYFSERFWTRHLAKHLSAVLILSDYRDNKRFADVARYEKWAVPTVVCPNFSIYAPASSARVANSNPVLIHVGEMLPHKNQMLGVEILSKLPLHYSMTFVHPVDTPYKTGVIARAEQLGVSDRIIYVQGKLRHELEPVIENSDCLMILTPSKDVQPIVAVDAMAKALPFVSTRVGCMPEFEGGLVTDMDADAMAGAINRIFTAAYSKYSDYALNYYKSNLSREKSKYSLVQVLENLK